MGYEHIACLLKLSYSVCGRGKILITERVDYTIIIVHNMAILSALGRPGTPWIT